MLHFIHIHTTFLEWIYVFFWNMYTYICFFSLKLFKIFAFHLIYDAGCAVKWKFLFQWNENGKHEIIVPFCIHRLYLWKLIHLAKNYYRYCFYFSSVKYILIIKIKEKNVYLLFPLFCRFSNGSNQLWMYSFLIKSKYSIETLVSIVLRHEWHINFVSLFILIIFFLSIAILFSMTNIIILNRFFFLTKKNAFLLNVRNPSVYLNIVPVHDVYAHYMYDSKWFSADDGIFNVKLH